MHEEEQRKSAIAVEKAEEHERTRIAAELHDNLGSQLSYISSNMDFILGAPALISDEDKNKRLVKLNEAAKNTITDLRETIWALKKESIEMEELSDRLKLYAQNQLSHKVNMKLNVEEKLNEKIVLAPSEALNIFRIFQEAINNAVKYSNADDILLTILSGPSSQYFISLKDNGKGFDTSQQYKGHYGLENMRERAKEVQLSLTITSSANNGTTIELSKNITG